MNLNLMHTLKQLKLKKINSCRNNYAKTLLDHNDEFVEFNKDMDRIKMFTSLKEYTKQLNNLIPKQQLIKLQNIINQLKELIKYNPSN